MATLDDFARAAGFNRLHLDGDSGALGASDIVTTFLVSSPGMPNVLVYETTSPDRQLYTLRDGDSATVEGEVTLSSKPTSGQVIYYKSERSMGEGKPPYRDLGVSSMDALYQRIAENEAATVPDALANVARRLKELRTVDTTLEEVWETTDELASFLEKLADHLREQENRTS